MKKSKLTDAQIAFVLHDLEEGTSVSEVCRKLGTVGATFCVYGLFFRCTERLELD